jgi:hypothetical protein
MYASSQIMPPKTISFRKDNAASSAELLHHSPPSLPTFERDGDYDHHQHHHDHHHKVVVTQHQHVTPQHLHSSAGYHHLHHHHINHTNHHHSPPPQHPLGCLPPPLGPLPPPPPYYSYPPVPYCYPSYPCWPPPVSYVSVEYITELYANDVLSGRGGATNSYRGNRAFRDLVKEYQEQYLQAKKRDKPAVASIIVEIVRKRGGRFLRRCNEQQGELVWVDIGDDRAREKTCQALREGAPEIRRKYVGRKGTRERYSPPLTKSMSDDIRPSLSSAPSEDGATLQSSVHHHHDSLAHHTDGPIRIRPWSRLMPRRGPVAPIELDQLPPGVREIYLRDFIPPTWSTSSSSISAGD